jgi:hypothetical protein
VFARTRQSGRALEVAVRVAADVPALALLVLMLRASRAGRTAWIRGFAAAVTVLPGIVKPIIFVLLLLSVMLSGGKIVGG